MSTTTHPSEAATSIEQSTPDTPLPTYGADYDAYLAYLRSLPDFLELLESVSYEEGKRLLAEFFWAEDWDPIGDMEEADRQFIAQQEENDPYND